MVDQYKMSMLSSGVLFSTFFLSQHCRCSLTWGWCTTKSWKYFFQSLYLSVSLNVQSKWSVSYRLSGTWDQDYWFGLHVVFFTIHTQILCLNTSRGSTIGRQEGQSPCFHLRHLASQLPGAATWVLLSSCFSRYIIFIGNKSCGIQDAHTYWEGTEHETMPHHLNS